MEAQYTIHPSKSPGAQCCTWDHSHPVPLLSVPPNFEPVVLAFQFFFPTRIYPPPPSSRIGFKTWGPSHANQNPRQRPKMLSYAGPAAAPPSKPDVVSKSGS
ncbi:hypothetical protein LY76DRAFT_376958 [Colletotrichum caudatum]|nr:hypothetical protein LY76DRAFT_376958 [Colletotrichum caudatum]